MKERDPNGLGVKVPLSKIPLLGNSIAILMISSLFNSFYDSLRH